MPVPVSSLSVAVQGVADFLDSQFGEEVTITVAHPQRASEIAKGAGVTAHCLNIFAYRVAPSGFHADAGSGDTQFLRIQALLTPFPADIDNAADDADIRILGHALRVLQSHPVLPMSGPPLPGAAITEPPGRKDYRLQAVMLAPTMEEINHIWTTQGAELAYRLSAVYEFALIPVEPLAPRVRAAPPRTVLLDTAPDMTGADLAFVLPGAGTQAIPLGDGIVPPPTSWLPVQMLVVNGTLTNTAEITAGTSEVTIALAGPAGERAAFQVTWETPGGEVPRAAHVVQIRSPRLDSARARTALRLAVPAGATGATIRVRPASGNAPVAGSAFGNALTLTVT